jgi:hypothetical protein
MQEEILFRRTRVPGLIWLALALTGGFGLFFIRNSIIVANDAAQTIANVQASEFMYRVALTSLLLSQVLTVFFAILAFNLFRSTNMVAAMVMRTAFMISSAFAAFVTLLHSSAIFLLNNADQFKGFSPDQINSLAYAMIRIANGPAQGVIELFWPVAYFTLGYLVIHSKVTPAVFGYMLMIVSVTFLANLTDKYLFPTFYPVQFTLLAQSVAAICILPNILWWAFRGIPGNSA